MGKLDIEHIIAKAKGGSDDEMNLWLSCRVCNGHKSNKISAVDPESGEVLPLFNPRLQHWPEHFQWTQDETRVVGLTSVGRATVAALHLDSDPDAIECRKQWVLAGWHPPARDTKTNNA